MSERFPLPEGDEDRHQLQKVLPSSTFASIAGWPISRQLGETPTGSAWTDPSRRPSAHAQTLHVGNWRHPVEL